MSKTWKITIDENELKALISFHGQMLAISGDTSTERSSRIHDLTKRLNKEDKPEIEKEDIGEQHATNPVNPWS